MTELESIFINGIHDKVKLQITYYAAKYRSKVRRLCAPMDIEPSLGTKDKSIKFHFWDYESNSGNHTTSILPKNISNIEATNIAFDPAEFVNWQPNWKISRDWGKFS